MLLCGRRRLRSGLSHGPATPKIDKVLAANLAKAKMPQEAKPYFFALLLMG